MANEDIDSNSNFLVSILGEVKYGTFPYFDDIYCKYCFVHGSDWTITSGLEEGISQIAKRGSDEEQSFVWNLPLNIVYKSTNPFGWPQLVISAYGLDVFGNEVVRGYGVTHAPISPGFVEKTIPMYVPQSTSIVQQLTSWLTGKRPEFTDARILTQGDSREVARVRSQGAIVVSLDATFREFQHFGYRS